MTCYLKYLFRLYEDKANLKMYGQGMWTTVIKQVLQTIGSVSTIYTRYAVFVDYAKLT